jgi:hypothetical protein
VKNKNRMAKTHNVIGIIEGSSEPGKDCSLMKLQQKKTFKTILFDKKRPLRHDWES